jgi:hypothetical protein
MPSIMALQGPNLAGLEYGSMPAPTPYGLSLDGMPATAPMHWVALLVGVAGGVYLQRRGLPFRVPGLSGPGYGRKHSRKHSRKRRRR